MAWRIAGHIESKRNIETWSDLPNKVVEMDSTTKNGKESKEPLMLIETKTFFKSHFRTYHEGRRHIKDK